MADNSFNKVQINTSALHDNYAFIKKLVGPRVSVMAMVKADAYGHGMVEVAKVFARAGCVHFGVVDLSEAVSLRLAGIEGYIYVTMGFAKEDVGIIFQHDLTPIIYSYESALALSRKAVELGRELAIHIKVDTGMGRLGISINDLTGFLEAISQLGGINIAGIMSHFPESDNPHSVNTKESFATFSAICREFKDKYNTICHVANSGAVLNFPNTWCDMVRAGIALYGYHPTATTTFGTNAVELLPAMSFSTRVLQVKTLPTGAGISYGHTFTTKCPSRLAVLPVGYGDGYSRSLSNRAEVLIHGRRLPVRGRVCMNMCMVDLGNTDDIEIGDEVVLLGRQGLQHITADEIAELMHSISYEVLCLLGNNNQREYIE